MAAVSLENLGAVGLVLDRASHELPPEALSYGENVRFRQNGIEKFQGYKEVYASPTIAPYYGITWPTGSVYYWVYAGQSKIYRMSNSGHSDITRYTTTPGDNDYNANADSVWTGGVFGGVPFLNNNSGLDYPQQWDAALGRMKDLDNWPANVYCKSIRAFKQFLVALNITDGGSHYPHQVMWSTSADPGTVPTSWTPAGSNDAGDVSLSETSGHLIDAGSLGDILVIQKEGSLWGMQYTGGQSIFRFWKMFSEIGALAAHCSVELERRQFLVGTGDVVLHDGVRMESVIDGRNRRWLFNNISTDHYHKTFVTRNFTKGEIWVCFVQEGSGATTPNRAMVWNIRDNTWSLRFLPGIRYALAGVIDTSSESQIINDNTNIIDTQTQFVDERTYNPSVRNVMMFGTDDSKFYQVDRTLQEAGENFTASAERTALTIVGRDRQGNPKVDPASIKFLRRVFPKMEATGPVDFYFAVQDFLTDAITWKGPYSFNPQSQSKIDLRISGKYLGYKIQSTGNVDWKLYGLELDLDVIGKVSR